MAYPYNGQLSPQVGGGLGGLPFRKSAVASVITSANNKNPYSTPFSSGLTSTEPPLAACQFSESSAIVFFRAGGTAPALALLSIDSKSNQVITKGATNTSLTGTGASGNIVKLTNNLALCAFSGNSGYLDAASLTISGTSIVSGTQATNLSLSGVASQIELQRINDSQALCAFLNTTTGVVNFCVLTVSLSGVVTSGSVLTTSLVAPYHALTALDSATAIYCHQQAASSYSKAVVVAISGTSVSINTGVDCSGGVQASNQTICQISPSSALLTYLNGTTNYYNSVVLSVVGGAIVVGTIKVTTESQNGTLFGSLLNLGGGYYCHVIGVTPAISVLSISSLNIISYETSSPVFIAGSGGANSNTKAVVLKNNKILVMYSGTSGAIQACLTLLGG